MNKKGDLNIGLVMLGVFIISFWLLFPFSMKMLYSNSYTEMNIDTYKTISNTGASPGSFIDSIKIWFKYLIMDIPDIPIYLKFIVYILQMISLLFIIGLLMELIISVRALLPF